MSGTSDPLDRLTPLDLLRKTSGFLPVEDGSISFDWGRGRPAFNIPLPAPGLLAWRRDPWVHSSGPVGGGSVGA